MITVGLSQTSHDNARVYGRSFCAGRWTGFVTTFWYLRLCHSGIMEYEPVQKVMTFSVAFDRLNLPWDGVVVHPVFYDIGQILSIIIRVQVSVK